ncbi:hypothetical protein [Methanosphaera sp. BMS]|uniref:hypothetical protein n=1 Tax=Methanosphaera sp. BMS TaxID=1789762 RepID=UPI000DC1D9DD|nr:hypothetical protein [Methanosphaera sp. BMS]AWX32719.1 hypothetical protein AW729_06225 [Methanosphaera sp. BMS]
MVTDYKLVSEAKVDKSMIRKIGEYEFIKIIPGEKNVQVSKITQTKITEPIVQEDEIIIKAYPQEVKLFKNENKDVKYETRWLSMDNKRFDIPLADIKTIHSLLQAKNIMDGNILHLSNVLSLVIKQNTLKEEINKIKHEYNAEEEKI